MSCQRGFYSICELENMKFWKQIKMKVVVVIDIAAFLKKIGT
jgi:hypothetical protein